MLGIIFLQDGRARQDESLELVDLNVGKKVCASNVCFPRLLDMGRLVAAGETFAIASVPPGKSAGRA